MIFRKKIETEKRLNIKASFQLQHLLAIADHEQGFILQPLIYDDPSFSAWVERLRAWYANWASPELHLVFNHSCDTDAAQLKSVAPKKTVLENFASRMNWIRAAAENFHDLMQNRINYMETELTIISSWVQKTSVPVSQNYYVPM
ncbi:DUF2515 family protein [Duganella sp. Leaf126]|uniref:DUF2515 family protein n=1 Tax=Duganella sp. Leaf126 TaxID=1736266 RepID=UPI001E3D1B73|nr:hypothetical protein [Duganella sp. Leaf126]